MRSLLGSLAAVATLSAMAASPSTARAGGAWTLPEGVVWGKVALLYLDSDQMFADREDERFELMGCVAPDGTPAEIEAGDRRPYDCTTGGSFVVSALYFDLWVGIVDGLTFSLQIPWIVHTSFENDSGLDGSDGGLGDVRTGLQYRFLERPLVAAVRLEVKAPTGSFSTDEAVPPLGEGQWDVTLAPRASRGFDWGWLSAEVGYRARFTNPDTRIDVGDEILAGVDVGVKPLDWLAVELDSALLWGFESEEAGAPRGRPRRWVWNERLKVLAQVHEHVGVEASVEWPVLGEGYPADPIWGIAVFGQTPPLWDLTGGDQDR